MPAPPKIKCCFCGNFIQDLNSSHVVEYGKAIHRHLIEQVRGFYWQEGLRVHNACRVTLSKAKSPAVGQVAESASAVAQPQVHAQTQAAQASAFHRDFIAPLPRSSAASAPAKPHTRAAQTNLASSAFASSPSPPSSSSTSVASPSHRSAPSRSHTSSTAAPQLTFAQIGVDRVAGFVGDPDSVASTEVRQATPSKLDPRIAATLSAEWDSFDPVSDPDRARLQLALRSATDAVLDQLHQVRTFLASQKPPTRRVGRVGGSEALFPEARDHFALILLLSGIEVDGRLPSYCGRPSARADAASVDLQKQQIDSAATVAAGTLTRASIRQSFLELSIDQCECVVDFMDFLDSSPLWQMRILSDKKNVHVVVSIDIIRAEFGAAGANFSLHPVTTLLEGHICFFFSHPLCSM